MKADPAELTLVRRLASAGAYIEEEGTDVRLIARGSVARAASGAAFRRLRAQGALQQRGDGRWELSQAGRSLVRRLALPADDLAAQHQLRARRPPPGGEVGPLVTVDLSESPLAWLRARKGRDGEPMLDAASFEAGERLRADFTRGQMMPSVTTNWSFVASGGRRSGMAGGAGELTEAAMAARLRVERALAALGPELSGPVLDFCCYLKGIEVIERERDWPKRSARLVLQLGLSALARHYGFAQQAIGPAAPVARRSAS